MRLAPLAPAAFAAALASRPSFATAAEPLPHAGPVLSRADSLERLKREYLTLVAARHRLTQARADVVAAGLWTNPNITVNGFFATHGAVTGGNEEVSVSIDQVIPIAGQVGLRKDFARGVLTAEERAYAANVWDVVSDAKVAYVDLQRAQAKWRVVRAGITDLARVEPIVTHAPRPAPTPPTTASASTSSAASSKVGSRRASPSCSPARATLAQAIGQSVDGRTVTAEDAIDDAGRRAAPLPAGVDALVKRALAQPPRRGQRPRPRRCRRPPRRYLRRQVVPSPDLSVGYIRFIDAPGASFGTNGGAMLAGVSFPIPILDHGQGTIDRGLALAAEDRARKDAVELAARREIERTVATMAVRVATWRRFRDTTSLDIDRLRTIGELSYREGRATILELLDAYASYVDAQERRIELHPRPRRPLSTSSAPSARREIQADRAAWC